MIKYGVKQTWITSAFTSPHLWANAYSPFLQYNVVIDDEPRFMSFDINTAHAYQQFLRITNPLLKFWVEEIV